MTDSNTDNNNSSKNRRRSNWAPGSLQRKIVITTFCVSAVVVLFNIQFSLLCIWLIHQNPSPNTDEFVSQTKSMLFQQLGVATLAIIPLSIWMGLTFFKVFGPFYRFKKYLLDFPSSRWDVACSLRKTDRLAEIVEMKDAINGAIKSMTGTITRQDQMLREARGLIEKSSPESSIQAEAENLIGRINAENTEFDKKFGQSDKEAASEEVTQSATADTVS